MTNVVAGVSAMVAGRCHMLALAQHNAMPVLLAVPYSMVACVSVIRYQSVAEACYRNGATLCQKWPTQISCTILYSLEEAAQCPSNSALPACMQQCYLTALSDPSANPGCNICSSS